MGCYRQESRGTAIRPLGVCIFLWMVTAGSLNPTKPTRLSQLSRDPLLTEREGRVGEEHSTSCKKVWT